MRRPLVVVTTLLLLVLASSAGPAAQSKPTLTPADYDQFESVAAGAARGGLSADGRWLAYAITRVAGNNELRITPIGGSTTRTVPFGSGAVFTSTSQWIAYGIGQSEAEQERLRAARQPIQRKLGFVKLADNTETIVDGVESFAFDRAGQSLAMKRYGPAPAGGTQPAAAGGAGRGGGAAAAAADAAPIGTTLLVRDLASGRSMTFGNVTEYAWQPAGGSRLLALVISADGRVGNGVHLYDAATGILRVLDSSAADYSSLVWRDDSSDLVVLRSKTDETRDGPTQVALAWTSVGTPAERLHTLDPTAGTALPANRRIVSFRRASWLMGLPGLTGPQGSSPMIMLGVGEWAERPAPPAPGARGAGAGGGRGAAGGGETGGRGGAATPPATERPDVDVWHWNDAMVMPRQKLNVAADRRRNLPAVWHVTSGRLVTIGQSFDEQISPIRGTTRAFVSEFTPYLMERSIGRPSADVSVIDLTTGARRPVRKGLPGFVSASTGGRYGIFSTAGHYWTVNLDTLAITNITAGVKTSFADLESDSTGPERPMFGVAGWTKGDEAVLLYDKFDIWRVSPAGGSATRLTNGASERVRHRLVSFEPPGEPLDPARAFVSLFGTHSKKSGYGRLGAGGSVTRLVWADKSVASLAKAEDADVFVYSMQAADDSPDLFVAGPDLTAAKPVTTTNAFLSRYAWTRAELVEYVVQPKGKPKTTLQGILHYPANYEPGVKYPMVVYLYEKLSDGLHRFQNPSERDYYNGTSLTQTGYFFFQPDIVFQPREPGVSVAECVTAAVRAVVDKGVVDATKVGVMGHSWGGFDSMYLSTHTKIFAAAVSGAGISNLISNYGNHHWSSGIAETDHIETGQQRMVVPLYEDLPAYIRNSAVFGISTMTTPMLLMTGDNDGTVFWHQSVEFYNIARRATKPVVMLVYNGEDHGLRVKKNQIDYHRRIRAWFDHYLKGAPAADWITNGVSASSR